MQETEYQPRTDLGKLLIRLRNAWIAAGMDPDSNGLLSEDEVLEYVRQCRAGNGSQPAR